MKLGFHETKGLSLVEELKTIAKKSKLALQPVFEAIMNSFEAIEVLNNGEIAITFNIHKDLFTGKDGKTRTKKCSFRNITILDNGIGFNDQEFNRLFTLRDNSKRKNNKGTGRIQYLHYFETTQFISTYKDAKSSTKCKQCTFSLSKSPSFLSHNALINVEKNEEIDSNNTCTKIIFTKPIEEKDGDNYANLSVEEIKDQIIKYFLNYFCENRASLPKITITRVIDDKIELSVSINEGDIPTPKHTNPFSVNYSVLQNNQIVPLDREEEFTITVFLIEDNKLPFNNIVLTSKGTEAKTVEIESLLPNEKIDGHRYLVLVSGDYIDNKDSDLRGDIKILTSEQYIEQNKDTLSPNEVILLDTMLKSANAKLRSLCPEIERKFEKKRKGIDELKKMFLLDEQLVNESDIKIDDTDEVMLRKVYQADARRAARKDATLRKLLKEAEKLDPTNTEMYQQDMTALSKKMVAALPLKNRNELAKYIARRRIVLTWIDKVLENQKKTLKNGGRIAEKTLHNLIFRQNNADPENSDLWFINEEFIYFKGFSNVKLALITIDGELIFKKQFLAKEERYLHSLGENRLDQKPDILLFPDEGKCIIIEFKALDVNVSDHLTQINKYATLIANYTKDKYRINTFYGYLIGEAIEPMDILSTGTGNWERSTHFDYMFRPSQNLYNDKMVIVGSLYTEVIKYSTLLARAKRRNEIFIKKLESNNSSNVPEIKK
ncbi:MAG: hypothetical protein LBL58_15850 [Tannerellaceae bacterium]|jgi:hypothetical protein|nr:hypothetical protein [Tannerellaceae bacterium]